MVEQYAVVEQELNYQLVNLEAQVETVEVEVEIDAHHNVVAVEDGPLHAGEGPFILQIVVMSVVKLAIMPETAEIKEDVLGVDHVPDHQDEGHTHHLGHVQETGHVPKTDLARGIDLVPDLVPGRPAEIAVDHMTVDRAHVHLLEIGKDHPLDQCLKIEIKMAIILNSYIELKIMLSV